MLNLKQLTASEDSLLKEKENRESGLRRSIELTYFFNSQLDSAKYISIPDSIHVLNPLIVLDSLNKADKVTVYDMAFNTARNTRSNVEYNKSDFDARTVLLRKHQVEWHRKFTLSIACLVLFFIGAPLGAIIRKGGLGLPLIISVVFFVIYHVISMTGEKSVKADQMEPFVGMWLSSVVLLPLGIILTIKATTDSPLFDVEAWQRFFLKLIKRRETETPKATLSDENTTAVQ
jgi:lipopolysaccharide export system permease protein